MVEHEKATVPCICGWFCCLVVVCVIFVLLVEVKYGPSKPHGSVPVRECTTSTGGNVLACPAAFSIYEVATVLSRSGFNVVCVLDDVAKTNLPPFVELFARTSLPVMYPEAVRHEVWVPDWGRIDCDARMDASHMTLRAGDPNTTCVGDAPDDVWVAQNVWCQADE
jgi:hypothetical protein